MFISLYLQTNSFIQKIFITYEKSTQPTFHYLITLTQHSKDAAELLDPYQ